MKNQIFSTFNLSKIRAFKSLLTLIAFDTSTEEGRSKERYRRSIITTLTTVASKCINFAAFAISIPLTIGYLGKERFGLWMTMSSIILMANVFSDLGLGTALMNKTSELKGTGRKDLLQGYLSSTLILLIAVSGFIMLTYASLSFSLDWPLIFKLNDELAIKEVNVSMWLLVIVFSINLPFTLVEKFQEGNQEGYLNNFWQSIGNILTLLGILVLVHLKLGLPFLVLISFGIPTLTRIANFCYQFYIKNPWAKPEYGKIHTEATRNLMNIGFVFFSLNVFNVLGVHSDNFIISGTMGASEVALYSILQKLSMTALIFWSFTSSLWPAYAEALARKDYAWVRATIKTNLLMSLITGTAIGLLMVFTGKFIIKLLTNDLLIPSISLLSGFAFYIFVTGFVTSMAVIFNASFLYKRQMKYFITASCVSLGLKFFLGSKLGVAGIIWATTIGYGIFYVVPAFFILNDVFWKKNIYR